MRREARDKSSLVHTKWNRKYHIVFAPKYRRKIFYEEKRLEIQEILAGALTPKFPTDEHMIKLQKFKRIILAFDNDEFGLKFAKVVQEQLESNGISTSSLKFDGVDIGSAMKDLTQRRIIINQIKSAYSYSQ